MVRKGEPVIYSEITSTMSPTCFHLIIDFVLIQQGQESIFVLLLDNSIECNHVSRLHPNGNNGTENKEAPCKQCLQGASSKLNQERQNGVIFIQYNS